MPFTPLLGFYFLCFVTQGIKWPRRPRYAFFGKFFNGFSFTLSGVNDFVQIIDHTTSVAPLEIAEQGPTVPPRSLASPVFALN
jgi:hypothetical protein